MSASARQRVLDALLDGPKTTAQLCQPEVGGERFGARVMELRADGHLISSQRVREGSWLYAHTGRNTVAPAPGDSSFVSPGREPAPPSTSGRAVDVLGAFRCCDACGFTWHDRQWPTVCPNCKAPSYWISSHFTEDGARLHVPITPPEVAAAA